MSFEQRLQEILAKMAGGQGNTFVYIPVTVNVNLGSQPDPDLAMLDRMLGLADDGYHPSRKGDAWNAAEEQAQQDEKERQAAEAASKGDPATDEEFDKVGLQEAVAQAQENADFKGTVSQQTLVDKALKLGLKETAGYRLWDLLDTSKGLHALCADHEVDFPPLGKNNQFRRADLRALANLEGITGVPGFGTRSQAFKVLKSL